MANNTKNRFHPPRGSHTQNNHDPESSRGLIRRIEKVTFTDSYGINSASALARFCDVGDNTVRGWIKHGYFPSQETEPLIEQWLDCPVTALMLRVQLRVDTEGAGEIADGIGVTVSGFNRLLKSDSVELYRWRWRRLVRWTYSEWFERRASRSRAEWQR